MTECERRAHTSLNAETRRELCENAPKHHELGPAACSITAKDGLRLKVSDMLELCRGAMSASPAECMMKLDVSSRAKIGIALCSGAKSLLPMQCYQALASTKNIGPTKSAQLIDHVVDFCNSIEDPAQLDCAQAALQHSPVGLEKALVICTDVIERIYAATIPQCIQHMKRYIQPSVGLTAEKVVMFCAHMNPSIYQTNQSVDPLLSTAAMDCFDHSTILSGRSKSALTAVQRLSLCSNAPTAMGPVNCSQTLLSVSDSSKSLRGDEVVSLCRGAYGGGPASCFVEAKSLGNADVRIQLCNAASGPGPAHCYRRASGLFRSDDNARLELCIAADSEAPADCVAALPHYLSHAEKIHICEDARLANYNDPSRCLQAVQTLSSRFSQAPKRALGYFIENIVSERERRSRQLLLQLCSFSDSQDPLAAAECFKSVPTSIEHDEAAMMCRNISSSEVIGHLLLCYRILPVQYTIRPPSPEGQVIPNPSPAAILCDGLHDRSQVEAAVKCVVEASRLSKLVQPSLPSSTKPKGTPATTTSTETLGLTIEDVAKVCNSDSTHGAVLHCLRQVTSPPIWSAIHAHHVTITNQSVLSLCRGAPTKEVGDCLVQISTQAMSRHLLLDVDVPAVLCQQPSEPSNPMPLTSMMSCLSAKQKRLITVEDVSQCRATPRRPTTVRLYGLQTDSGTEHIVANERFSLFFQVFDQYNQLISEPVSTATSAIFSLSVDAKNVQGAVLLGHRANSTNAQGILAFHNLMITQPGGLDLKIHLATASSGLEVMNLIKLNVVENPLYVASSHCLYIFTHAVCDASDLASYHEALFPSLRSLFSPSQYLTHLDCLDKVQLWQVKASVLPSGHFLVEYKAGLDSLWTGINMISPEMDMYDRLGVTQGERVAIEKAHQGRPEAQHKAMLKLIRRGYYRASLQWHPDRWVGYDHYQYAIQAAFQLVTEAYERLQMELSNAASSPEPVYA